MASGLQVYQNTGEIRNIGQNIRVTYSDTSFVDVWKQNGVRVTYSSGGYEDIYWGEPTPPVIPQIPRLSCVSAKLRSTYWLPPSYLWFTLTGLDTYSPDINFPYTEDGIVDGKNAISFNISNSIATPVRTNGGGGCFPITIELEFDDVIETIYVDTPDGRFHCTPAADVNFYCYPSCEVRAFTHPSYGYDSNCTLLAYGTVQFNEFAYSKKLLRMVFWAQIYPETDIDGWYACFLIKGFVIKSPYKSDKEFHISIPVFIKDDLP